jgi:predicted nucleic acid-binding Zn ribbon protein
MAIAVERGTPALSRVASRRYVTARRTYAYPPAMLASPRSPVCRTAPIHARQEVCSLRCRVARSRQRKAEARRARDAEIRALLEAAVEKLREEP